MAALPRATVNGEITPLIEVAIRKLLLNLVFHCQTLPAEEGIKRVINTIDNHLPTADRSAMEGG